MFGSDDYDSGDYDSQNSDEGGGHNPAAEPDGDPDLKYVSGKHTSAFFSVCVAVIAIVLVCFVSVGAGTATLFNASATSRPSLMHCDFSVRLHTFF
jgi:hypothetical protein